MAKVRASFQRAASDLISRIKSHAGVSRKRVKGVLREADDDFSVAVPFNYLVDPIPKHGPIAVICHIFHAELCAAIRRQLENIPFAVDLFISTDTSAKRGVIEHTFSAWNRRRVEVRIAPNRGRDIAPKFVTFRDVYEHYDLLLFLHSKKSAYMETGADWREVLMQTLLGSPEIVCSVIEAFRRHPSLGMIIPQHYETIRDKIHWGGNFQQARRLARRMGFTLSSDQFLDFPSGSMFWARSAALQPVLDLGLRTSDFSPEAGQIDGTTAHALERLMLYACEHAGFSWLKIANPSFFENHATIVPIESPVDLDAFMHTHSFQLMFEILRR